MRWLPIITMLTIAWTADPIVAADQHLDGFQDTRWGMSESQVQEIYGGKLARWTTRAITHFGLKHYDVNQCDFTVEFIFDGKGLSHVALTLNDQTKSECTDKVIQSLRSKYGPPSVDGEPSIRGTHASIWFLGNTMVTEFDAFWQATRKSTLFINYEPTQTAGAQKL